MLQYLRANDYPWNGDVCVCAAKAGEFDVLKWAGLCSFHTRIISTFIIKARQQTYKTRV